MQHSSNVGLACFICEGVEGPRVPYRIALADSQYKVYDEGRVNHLCPGHFCKSRNLSCINVAFLAYVLKCLCYISPHQSTYLLTLTSSFSSNIKIGLNLLAQAHACCI